ncbi:hypothetical protein TVNIR_3794 [Thioalkalivibrio nitratireducens DSM 14787]|uniref:Uncharacterized protein n=1 Tax=Thioalkalivibrio nitratireducens (strain DSM 14787 / UNIQEM 213 / ALEN2) TaxID=1255043 RepID=L0E2J7_THIND|nr:hypothetical protein TVNIR_3794 [Thioalkalivibrio nitratireducens DSM 14787]
MPDPEVCRKCARRETRAAGAANWNPDARPILHCKKSFDPALIHAEILVLWPARDRHRRNRPETRAERLPEPRRPARGSAITGLGRARAPDGNPPAQRARAAFGASARTPGSPDPARCPRERPAGVIGRPGAYRGTGSGPVSAGKSFQWAAP